ncbi:MAG TPA: carboxypeptidase regulatory-like domain-containing protein [Planctomycetes bacterium]|nr:carboxypeptidase regulatory-like domain-containing protein [Planctomycetota bacterium]
MKRNAFLLAALLLGVALYLFDREGGIGERAPLVLKERPALEAGASAGNGQGRTRAPDLPPDPGARAAAAGSSGRTAARVREDDGTTRHFRAMVVGPNGRLGDARVRAYSEGRLVGETRSERSGRFDLALPSPLPSLILRVDAPGLAFLERDLGPQVAGGAQNLGNLFLRPGSELAGLVEDTEGRPIAGARVQVSTLRGHTIEVGVGETLRSDAKGRFRFAVAPEGSVVLTARAEGFGETSVEFQHRPRAEARIVLPPGHELRIRVVDTSGTALPDVLLWIRSEAPGSPPRSARTDETGRATFSYLATSTWNLRAEKTGYKPSAMFRVEADKKEIEMRLVAWPGGRGRVETVEGLAPPPGTRVFTLPMSTRGDLAGRLSGGTEVAEDGSFRLIDLRPGDYRAIVRAPGYADGTSRPFHVSDRGEVDIGVIRVDHGGNLELRLRLDGKPVGGVRAELLERAPVPAQLFAPPTRPIDSMPASTADGLLTLENLTPGRIWLILRGEGVTPRSLGPFSITTGDTGRPGPIELEPGAPIRGTVLDPTGAPVAGARLHIRGTRASVPFLTTEADGSFETPPLPVGTYRVETNAVIGGRSLRAPDSQVRIDGKSAGSCEIRFEDGGS